MYNEDWYNNETRVLEEKDNYLKLDYGCKGKGELTVYRVFPNIDLYFMDMDTGDIFKTADFPQGILSISHCKKGRYECQFANEHQNCLSEGCFSINGTDFLPERFCFPMKKYEGLSIVVDWINIPEKVLSMMNVFGIDFERLKSLMDGEKSWFVSDTDSELFNIFNDLYKGVRKNEMEYLRLKVMEALYYIGKIEIEKNNDYKYFDKEMVNNTRAIREYIINNIGSNLSIEKLVAKTGMNINTFYSIFMKLYGETPYAHLKKYRMNLAAVLLLTGKRKIGDIAVDLGYSNASKFSKAFYSVYGELPSSYRKKNI
ncbi:helix-turn-helix domain-containing protein [Acetitomaculum ruminis]|nr:AraC family transcriptional regulator [Acetitomaculum ruminis]